LRKFDEPIILPPKRGRARTLITLKDAGEFITKLPKAEHEAKEWQAAMSALLLAVRGGPMMMASIGMRRAIHRHKERVFTDRKDHHWDKQKLAGAPKGSADF
jgi:hypothetical protein